MTTGLTEVEEKRLIILMEGDVSDVDIESEDENNDENEEELIRLKNILDPDTEENIELNISNIQIEEEISRRKENMKEGEDIPDDVPLATIFGIKTIRKASVNRQLLWKKKDIDEVERTCNINHSHNEILTPLSYFKMFFDNDIINNIAFQTNLYACQKDGNSINTTYSIVCQFLGINILTGIVRMSSYRMYWAKETRFSSIADVMSRNRFDKLRNYIHLNNNTDIKERGDDNYDRLFKVRPFINAIKEIFRLMRPLLDENP